MPYDLYIYLIITFSICFVLKKFRHVKKENLPLFFPIFLVYIFLIDVTSVIGVPGTSWFYDISVSLLMIILFLLLIQDNLELSINLISLSFTVITIYFSILLFSYKEQFTTTYDASGLERVGWTDPNYLGMIMGMGTVLALCKLFDKEFKNLSLFPKLINISAVALSIPALLMLASRGAMLSVIVALVLIVIFSRVSKSYKILVVLAAAYCIVWLYDNQYFDLLIYRIENDAGGGSNRTDIWAMKLGLFFNGDFLQMLFGYGYYGGMHISGRIVGFHNDYIGFLVEYGIIGCVCFLYMLIFPLIKTPRNSPNFIRILAVVAYIASCSFSLEPYTAGRFPYYVFYLYGLLRYMESRKKTVKNSQFEIGWNNVHYR